MYLPNYFSENNPEHVQDLIRNNHFATLVVIIDGEIEVLHAPLYLDSTNNCLLGHIARANLVAKELLKNTQIHAKIIFNGENGYISHTYYSEPHKNVPTWNYATVHIDGTLSLIDAKSEIIDILDLQFVSYETERLNWELEYLNKLLNGIVGIKIAIEQITAKFKLSQNRSSEDINSVIAHLLTSEDARQISLGQYMQSYYQGR